MAHPKITTRTVKHAALVLKRRQDQLAFERAWEACDRMDLYDGELNVYFDVMRQTIIEERNEKDKLLRVLRHLRGIIEANTSPTR